METGKGAQTGGELFGLGDPCSSTGPSIAGFLSSSKTAATFHTGTSAAASGTPPPPTAYSQDMAVGTFHLSNHDCLSQ